MENGRKTGFGRLRALWVVLGRAKVARKRARDGLRTASWAVLVAKLAVLAAMLAVLDAKLAARDDPNSARSRPRPRFERVHQLERRSYRFFVVFVLSRESSDVPRVPVFTVFCWVRTKLARHARARRESSKIEAFRPPKTVPRPSKTRRNRARAAKTSAKSEVNPNFLKQERPERFSGWAGAK